MNCAERAATDMLARRRRTLRLAGERSAELHDADEPPVWSPPTDERNQRFANVGCARARYARDPNQAAMVMPPTNKKETWPSSKDLGTKRDAVRARTAALPSKARTPEERTSQTGMLGESIATVISAEAPNGLAQENGWPHAERQEG